jgi:tetratricopeptide (TPR) repeat protein
MAPNDTSGLIFICCAPEDRRFAQELTRRLESSLLSKSLIITTINFWRYRWPYWPWWPWLEEEWLYPWRSLKFIDEEQYEFLEDYVARTSPDERKAIFLFLLSPDTYYHWQYYLRESEFMLHNDEQIRSVGILVRPIAEKTEIFKNSFPFLQLLPSNGQAVTTWSSQDKAWADVTQDICALVEDFYGRVPVQSGSTKSRSVTFLAGYLSHRLSLGASWQRFLTYFRNLRMSLLLRRGALPLALGQYEKALHDYEQALLTQSDRLDLHIGRGKALLGLKRSQEALDTFNTVLRRDPKSAKAFKGQGRAYEQLAQQVFEDLNQQAEECYERAKQLGVEET